MNSYLPFYIPDKQLSTVVRCSTFLLIFLFVYTAISKLISFENFREQMFNQLIPDWIAVLLVWTLPVLELITATLLYVDRFRYTGFWLALALMAIFTAYVAMVLSGYLGEAPCSCGGVLKSMDWKTHLFFNLFFLLLSVLGIYGINRERSVIGKE